MSVADIFMCSAKSDALLTGEAMDELKHVTKVWIAE